jgi:hypothetical protein
MIPPQVESLLRKHRSTGVILDANLLVLLIVGRCDRRLISEARPTRNHALSNEDYELLLAMLLRVGRIVTTAHVLAETCNLLDQIKSPERVTIFEIVIEQMKRMTEAPMRSVDCALLPCFPQLALTDSGLVKLAAQKHLLITMDAPLANELARARLPVINFNRLRPFLSRGKR